MLIVMKSVILNLLEPSRFAQACAWMLYLLNITNRSIAYFHPILLVAIK